MRRLKKIKERAPKKRLKRVRCAFRDENNEQCRRRSVGKSSLCVKHGGKKEIIEDTLVSATRRSLVPVNNAKFDPSHHPIEFLNLAREGKSDVEIAAEMEISPVTLQRWSEKYKEFAYVYELGQAMQEAWYITQAKNNLTNTRFQTGLFKFLATNKLGYAEKIETRNENVNKNIGVLLVPPAMSVDEWEQANILEDEDVVDAEIVSEDK